ncbi:MAG: N-acetylmuramoyl-L-alanine amidase, partial [Nitrospinota bacterium]
TVVIDPGHGGRDFGAKSMNLALEKDVTRKLARLIKETIEEQNGERVKVVITHSGISEAAQADRSFAAAKSHGDVYISLHAASGFDQSSRDLGIYIWEKEKSTSLSWKNVNGKHRTSSLVLAEKLRKHLGGFYRNKNFFVRSSRLLTLYGIDMPAVVIEVIALNDPKDEIRLNGSDYYKKLSALFYSALTDYDRNL